MKYISINIKNRLKYNKMKIKDLESILGIKNRTLSRYINGHVIFKLEHIIKLSEVFNCSIDSLVKKGDD